MSLHLRLKRISLVIALSVIFTVNTSYRADAGGLVMTSRGDVGGGETGQLFGVTLFGALITLVGFTIMYPTILTKRKNRAADFAERFKARPRKMQTELKRRSGKTYRWVTQDLLELRSPSRYVFECLLREKSRKLDRYLKRAQSLKRPAVDKLARWLVKQGDNAKKPNTLCAIEGKYLSNPQRFVSDLKTYQGPTVEWLLTEHLGHSKVFLRSFRCQLLLLRDPIASALRSLQQPQQRFEGARKLFEILRGLDKSWRSTRCELD